MNKLTFFLSIFFVFLAGCGLPPDAGDREAEAVREQQDQYLRAQPAPAFDYSFERDQVIQLYKLRNEKVSTHSVWRSFTGQVEGDCPSMGFGIPYDTSLTNPQMLESRWEQVRKADWHYISGVVGQAEPNGIFASTNTSATWVMCTDEAGQLLPHYIESKVTVYPYPVLVDYDTNRVMQSGDPKAKVVLDK